MPIVLVSGKKLSNKASYIRIVFKEDYCIKEEDSCHTPKQMIFYISSGDLLRPPMILVSKTLPKPLDFPGWRFENIRTNSTFFGEHVEHMYQLLAEEDHDAYTTLLQSVYHAERHLFSNIENLMASWKIWTPILRAVSGKQPRLYKGGDEVNELNFAVKGYNLEYITKAETESKETEPRTFLNAPLVLEPADDVIAKLAEDIFKKAEQAVSERSVFHLALSGGDSPKPLLRKLASSYIRFPWQHTHIWLVDERCVPLDHDTSNFHLLEANLLQLVKLPYLNIHPMPVHVHDEACEARDEGDILYEATIKRIIPDGRFDYILLGLGKRFR